MRDEVILALDLYFRVNPLKINDNNPEIVKLSQILNKLPLYPHKPDPETFRNPNGVYMKLCNFLSLDPGYKGKGLSAGSKLDEMIWNEFSDDRDRLSAVAQAILANSDYKVVDETNEAPLITDDDEFPEGRILSRVHRIRERNARLVKKKKRKLWIKREAYLVRSVVLISSKSTVRLGRVLLNAITPFHCLN